MYLWKYTQNFTDWSSPQALVPKTGQKRVISMWSYTHLPAFCPLELALLIFFLALVLHLLSWFTEQHWKFEQFLTTLSWFKAQGICWAPVPVQVGSKSSLGQAAIMARGGGLWVVLGLSENLAYCSDLKQVRPLLAKRLCYSWFSTHLKRIFQNNA